MEQVNSGHRERLKERFLKTGLDDFEPHNILELLLFFSIPRRDTNKLAHRLIDTFGTVSAVFDAPYEELLKVPGIGANSAMLIKMIPQLFRVYWEDKNSCDLILNSPEKIGNYMIPKFVSRENEVVYLLCMDNKGCVLNCSLLFEGSVNAAEVSVRRIVETAVKFSATAVVLAHNHPRGFAIPSSEDISTTHRLKKALQTVQIDLLDHIIVSGDDYVSLEASGVFAKL